MSFRFLYLDSDGEEIRLETQADLQRAVESGALAEDMLLYDALTAEWSPARTHPLVRLALDSSEETRTDDEHPEGGDPADEFGHESESAATESGPGMGDTLGPGDFSGLTLTTEETSDEPAPRPTEDAEGDDEDETVRAFRERLERERLRQRELGPGALDDGLSMVRGDRVADLHDPVAPDDEDRTPAVPDASETPSVPVERAEEPEPPPPGPVSGGDPLEPLDVPSGPRGSWARSRRPRPSSPPPPSATLPWGITPQAAILALLIGVAGWGIADALGSASDSEAPSETGTEVPTPAPVAEPEAEGAGDVGGGVDLRASTYAAFSDMQDGMEALGARLGVAVPPSAWLSGRYLADADTLPQVRDFWIRYGAFVDSIRATEEELFRSGFVSRLRSEGVTGSAVPIRLSGAIQDFRADSTRREEIYSSMDALAAEAIALDDWLREASDRIAFAGVRGGAVSMAPEIEAAPLDEETRRQLDTRLDRVLDALERVTGPDPGRARNLTGQVFTGVPEDESR